jgi:hypothetical protein
VVTGYEEKGSQDIDQHNAIWWHRESMIVQCLGCEAVSYYIERTMSEETDWEGEPIVTTEYFPPYRQHTPKFEPWTLPHGLASIYKETIKAIDDEQPILAAIGIRAIVEAVCTDLKVKADDLKKQIDKLQLKGLVTVEGARCLQTLRVLGNNAAHSVQRHTDQQLIAAIQVVEHLLEGTYILPDAIDGAFKTKPQPAPPVAPPPPAAPSPAPAPAPAPAPQPAPLPQPATAAAPQAQGSTGS